MAAIVDVRLGTDRPDVHAFVHRLEQPRERGGASIHGAIIGLRAQGSAVVTPAALRRRRASASAYAGGVAHFFSIAARMSRDASARARASASRRVATSMHTAQSTPCGSHSITSPLASRACTKQSSLPLWPPRSQPQKHGT